MMAMSCSDEPCRSMDVASECRSKCAAPRLGRTTPARRKCLSTIHETAEYEVKGLMGQGLRQKPYRRWSVAGLFLGKPRSPDPLPGSAAAARGDAPYRRPESRRPSSRCQSGGDVRHRPPEDPNGPAAARSPDPAGRRLRLDHRKRSDVPPLFLEDSAAEKPDANEPQWGWRHPIPRRIGLRRSGNAETCGLRWRSF